MNNDLLSVEDAFRAVLECCAPLPPSRVPLSMARGCCLAEDVSADRDSPPFDRSVVDGFAVRAADLGNGRAPLSIGEELYAGTTPSRPLAPGEAALIMTGAPLPKGADAVVMVERTEREGAQVRFDNSVVLPGQNVMPQGREMKAGDLVLGRGERLTPTRLGVLASVGRSAVQVVPVPRVAVVPTGDELVEPDQVPGPGQIRNSNAVVLEGLVSQAGAIPLLSPIAPDEPEALGEILEEGLASDVLLITGGVSAGQRDLVPGALARLGVTRVFHKVRLKPGKPLWFGVGPKRGDRPGTLVFGLPGNPVSGVVGFLLFVRPALDALAGRPIETLNLTPYPLAGSFVHKGERPTFQPVRWVDGALEPLNWGGSADLLTVARAHGFAHFPAGDRTYAPGDVVGFLQLG